MKLILLTFTCLLLGACSTSSKQPLVLKPVEESLTETTTHDNNMQQDELLFYLLRNSFSNWQGTPYRLGGNSKRGIDCSAFIKNVYAESFNIKLSRTTTEQVNEGYLVYRDQLKIGDLVFFKTGWNVRHVGIYMGNSEFIHASTSQGVMTSSLDNSYWTSKYWQARRILD
tara:strand:+ start:4319 stop:4828 length:510 start_codon:yes stop_codon:yes gene_type:complete